MGKAARMAVHYNQFQKLQTLMLQMGAAQFRPEVIQHVEAFAEVLYITEQTAHKEQMVLNKEIPPAYKEWKDLTQAVQEERRRHARLILANHMIIPLRRDEPAPAETPPSVAEEPKGENLNGPTP